VKKQWKTYNFSLPPDDKLLLIKLIGAAGLKANPWVKLKAVGGWRTKDEGHVLKLLTWNREKCCQAARTTLVASQFISLTEIFTGITFVRKTENSVPW